MATITHVVDARVLARALRLLWLASDNRCSIHYLKWMLGLDPIEDKERVLLAIRDELTSLGLIGWSYPPNGSPELFLSGNGKRFIQEHIVKT